MDSTPHSRNPSSGSSSSTGSSSPYQLILDHILSPPNTNEMPLRTMYTINSTPRAQALPPTRTTTPTFDLSCSPASPVDTQAVTAQFTASLMVQLQKIPQQQACLPPTFITSFLHKVFTPEIHLIDFCQALTGLDYLKDLEMRRRKEVAGALERLGITRRTLSQTSEEIGARFPGVAEWIRDLEVKECKIDQLYSRLYVSLRQWILINEMSLTPFNLHNCHAMLNTLYPPVVNTTPSTSTKLTPEILIKQREGFFRYIKAVDRKGPKVLATLIMQNASESESSGWPSTRRILESYLSLANDAIHECQESSPAEAAYLQSSATSEPVRSPSSPTFDMNTSSLDTASIGEGRTSRHGRKVDSGVSMHSAHSSSSQSAQSHSSSQTHSRRPSTAFSLRASGSFGSINRTDPLPPPTPSVKEDYAPSEYAQSSRSRGSTLERLAREFRRMRPRRRDTDEIFETYVSSTPSPSTTSPSHTPLPTPVSAFEQSQPPPSIRYFRPKSLRKMRSLTALSDLRHSNFSSATLARDVRATEAFDPEVMAKKAKEWERKQMALPPPPAFGI
ncbi:hypothetical protein P152DRAFT_470427 [Eremomyces bilateralis CBS 781.70]|uniref:Uncharacterized protein n=1 Tax=Eremomyces bilateralis CBS 781.70 TaxID=1392243 RepID=A0A6G1GEV2_9PEZI|nr:uncharacterized protein P152DRAFT_470427 [Eremomyces bilateralis CBS 781.70]KAF1816400.1 hypothetical protein P152DRAFT_470427 [Eremomyces bilateralis CBS 781.70]